MLYYRLSEENDQFPQLRKEIPRADLINMAGQVEGLKKLAPTRPHPDTHVSHGKAANLATGPVLGLIDRARDAFTGRQTTTTAPIS
eukprot:9953-Heterococcus_DN1.PRE.3